MATNPTRPILIPRTPTSPLDPSLRTSLHDAILNPETIKTLRKTLDSETQAHAWQEKVKQRSLQLLESREFWKWEDLVAVIVGESRGVEVEVEGIEGWGEKEKGVRGGQDGGVGEKVDIRIPEKAVMEAAKVVKGVLEKNVELEPEGKGFWG